MSICKTKLNSSFSILNSFGLKSHLGFLFYYPEILYLRIFNLICFPERTLKFVFNLIPSPVLPIYSWFLKPLSVLHSQFPTKKSWVVAYFWPPKFFSQIFFHFFLKIFMKQLFSADAIKSKKIKKFNFWHSKHEKTTSEIPSFQKFFF